MVPDGRQAWHGIYAATLTPLTPDFAVDEAALAGHVSRVAEVAGMVGVMCNGHAGENHLLTREEKRRVTGIVVEAIGTRSIVATAGIAWSVLTWSAAKSTRSTPENAPFTKRDCPKSSHATPERI